MIASIKGCLQEKGIESALIDVQGIGYEVFLPLRVLGRLVEGENVFFYTFHRLGENISELYGFTEKSEKVFFQTLLSVSGVGPKTAVAILEFPPQRICEAIETQDIAFITQVPGLGKKTASRLILEIQGKLPQLEVSASGEAGAYSDVIAALEHLGFEGSKITNALKNLPEEKKELADEQIIKWALKELSN